MNHEVTDQMESTIVEMPRIYEYQRYRLYLRDVFHFLKTQSAIWSHQFLARKIGVASRAHTAMIFAEKRHASPEIIRIMARLFKLDRRETEYLLLLAEWEKTGSEIERKIQWEKLLSLVPKPVYRLTSKELEFFSRWYTIAILEMVNLKGFQPQARWVKARLGDRVSIGEIHLVLSYLLKSGLIHRNEETGKYSVAYAVIFGGDAYRANEKEFVRNYHRSSIPLGIEMFDATEPVMREFNGSCLGIRSGDIPKIKDLIREFQQSVLELSARVAEAEAEVEEIYQLNVQFFPLTSNPTIDTEKNK